MRLIWSTNLRDPAFATEPIESFATRMPYWYPAICLHLTHLGWDILRLGVRESATPGRVARAMRAFIPQLLYSYGGVTSWQPIIARNRLRMDTPIIHGWDDYYDEIWRSCFTPIAGFFMRWLEGQVIRRSDYVMTISRYNQARAEAWGKRVWYIPNGCDVPRFDPALCSIRLEGDLKLVYVGDQAHYKRSDDILDAMVRLPPSIRLYIVGAPYPHVVDYATRHPNIITLGRVSENDKWSVMAQADVLVCTADQDCNAKFHEYLRMGKPILGYDGRPNLLFKNRRNALLTKDYYSAIRELQASPILRETLARNAVRDFQVLSWAETAQCYDVAFREIIDVWRASHRRARLVQ